MGIVAVPGSTVAVNVYVLLIKPIAGPLMTTPFSGTYSMSMMCVSLTIPAALAAVGYYPKNLYQ